MTTIYDYRTICDNCGKVQAHGNAADDIDGWYNLTFFVPPSRDPDQRSLSDMKDWDFCCFECLEAWCAKRRKEAQ